MSKRWLFGYGVVLVVLVVIGKLIVDGWEVVGGLVRLMGWVSGKGN